MSEEVTGTATHNKLITLLTEQGARFRVMEHEAVGKCEAVSELRGTALGQGAKALVCKVKGNGVKKLVLAILAADRQADLSQLANHFGGLKASLASPAEVDTLTACVFGAIPPFSFHPDLALVADPCSSSVTTKSRSTPGCWKSPWLWILRITCVLPVPSWLCSVKTKMDGWRVRQPFFSRNSTDITRITAMLKKVEEIISVSTNI